MNDQYITEAEGDLYFQGRLNSESWDDADTADKDKASIMATRAIDHLNFIGEKADASQTTQFPRKDDTVVPQDIKDATAEIAFALLDGIDPELEFENLSITSQGYANVRSSYDRTKVQAHIIAGIPSIAAWRFLHPYLRDPNRMDISRSS